MIALELPWPPSVNHYWVHTRRGVFIAAKGIGYRMATKVALREAKFFKPYTGPLAISLKLFPPDRRKRDIDNGLKCILDSLVTAGLMLDDSQVKRLEIEMMDEMANAVEVYVKQIDSHET